MKKIEKIISSKELLANEFTQISGHVGSKLFIGSYYLDKNDNLYNGIEEVGEGVFSCIRREYELEINSGLFKDSLGRTSFEELIIGKKAIFTKEFMGKSALTDFNGNKLDNPGGEDLDFYEEYSGYQIFYYFGKISFIKDDGSYFKYNGKDEFICNDYGLGIFKDGSVLVLETETPIYFYLNNLNSDNIKNSEAYKKYLMNYENKDKFTNNQDSIAEGKELKITLDDLKF